MIILTKLGMEIHLGLTFFKSLNPLIFMMLISLMSSKCIFEKYKQGLPYKIGAVGNIMHAQAQKTP
jgi:hypothetical protein